MKFSLKLLLSLTLLVVLSVNGLNNHYRSSQIRAQNELIEAEIDNIRIDLRFFDEKKAIYKRAVNAFERRKNDLSSAHEFFEPVAIVHGNSKIKNPSKVHIFPLGSATGKDNIALIHKQFRIWLPESPEFELRLGFHKEGEVIEKGNQLRNSFYFSPKTQFSSSLKPGMNLVEVFVPTNARTSKVEIRINGNAVHDTQRATVFSLLEMMLGKKGSFSSFPADDQNDFSPRPVILFTASLWSSEHEPESACVMLNPVAQNNEASE